MNNTFNKKKVFGKAIIGKRCHCKNVRALDLLTAFAVVIIHIYSVSPGVAVAQSLKIMSEDEAEKMTKVLITVGESQLTATLDHNASAQDFLTLLPLTLTLKDYANTEKVSDLPKPLSTEGAAEGIDPEIGDITYYAPWGNLAIFYRDFGYAKGLVRLGRVDAGIEMLNKHGPINVTIERVD